jgi:WD40 repeat protein
MVKLTRHNAILVIAASALFFSFLFFAYLTAPSSAQQALRVLSVRETDLIAGPMNTAAVLSPDGTRFAHVTRERLCIYSIDVIAQLCANLLAHDELRNLDAESISWSPDGRWLTFTSAGFITFRDADIWVMDTNTGALTNLTDDGTNTGLFQPETDGYMDASPRWLPDGRILFLRYAFFGGAQNFGPPELYAIAPAGGEPERLGRLPHDDVFTTVIVPAPDGVRIAYEGYDSRGYPDRYENAGPWLSDLDGSRAGPAWEWDASRDDSDSARRMLNAAFSPDGRYLLSIGAPDFYGRFTPESSGLRLTPLADVPTIPQLVDAKIGHVIGAGWSPSGAGLIYLVFDPSDRDAANGLYVAAEPGAPGQRVLQGTYWPPTPLQRMPLLWGENNTILLADENFQVVIVTLGQ